VEKEKEVISTTPRYQTDSEQLYSDNLVNILKYEEGDTEIKGKPKTTAYTLTNSKGYTDGMVTIGYGHAEPITGTVLVKVKGENGLIKRVRKNRSESYIQDVTTISSDEANALLKKDMDDNARYVKILIIDKLKKEGININITQPMFDAMVSISFNHGIGNLTKGPFMSAMRSGDLNKATEAIKTLGTAGGFSKGISSRRQKEYDMFKYGKYPD
jgi:GH24 family phage-related lysozyme (muramidase)